MMPISPTDAGRCAAWCLLAVALLGPLCVACDETDRPRVPPELAGRWVTDHPGYEGRFFEIDSLDLTIGTGLGPPMRHEIVAVEESTDADGLRHVDVVYLNESDDRVRFQLVFDPDDPGEVWSEHQASVVWTRQGSDR